MNTILRHRLVRAIAVAVGVVSTVVWAPFTFMVAVGSALHNFFSLLTLWAGFGALGLTGFWLWVLLARLRFRGARTLVSAFLAAGILAIGPLAVLNRLAFVLTLPAIAVGLFALTDLWLPDEPVHQSGGYTPRSAE